MMISLSKLKAIRAKMTMILALDSPQSTRIVCRDKQGNQIDDIFFDNYRDAAGIAATCDAIDILIEVVETALNLAQASEAYDEYDDWEGDVDANLNRLNAYYISAKDAHHASLKKVKP
jgi:hypothetical protein